ncbi:MAG: peptide deformylase [Zavarzinia sp.]|nr:peptide deformylase [Zavarzinia sp.]
MSDQSTILKLGNERLLKPSAPVVDPTAPDIRDLLARMQHELDLVGGIGLAAPQLDDHRRVILFCLPEWRIPEGSTTRPEPPTAVINPVLEPLGAEKRPIWERCLSLPGLYGRVQRYNHIRLTFQTTTGETVVREFKGYLAMLLQHEYDHLDGYLYPMRMEKLSDLAYASELPLVDGLFAYSAAEFDGLDTTPAA